MEKVKGFLGGKKKESKTKAPAPNVANSNTNNVAATATPPPPPPAAKDPNAVPLKKRVEDADIPDAETDALKLKLLSFL